MGESAPNLSPEERRSIVEHYILTFGGQAMLSRTVMNIEPPETVVDYVARNDHCFNGVKGTMDELNNNPPESETHQNALADGQMSITAYEQLLNPA